MAVLGEMRRRTEKGEKMRDITDVALFVSIIGLIINIGCLIAVCLIKFQ